MKKLLYFEWLHFSRNIARPVSLLLFLVAAVFGLYNGFGSYNERKVQLDGIREESEEMRQTVYEWFDSGQSGPEDRPWVQISSPYWSMWYANHYQVQAPDPVMMFNIGQSEHFAYYKKLTMMSTAFDADLTAELANPELVQLGSLDFSFVWMYLMPLLLIVLTHSIWGLEHDLGIISLLKIQHSSLDRWLNSRLLVVGLGMAVLLTILVWSPVAVLSLPFEAKEVFTLWGVYLVYLLVWLVLVGLVIRFGNGQADQALKMVGIWLLLSVVIPGAVNQYVLLKRPPDLMMSVIDASRDGQSEVFNRPKEQILTEAFQILPRLKEMEVAKVDSLLTRSMLDDATLMVLNAYKSDISNTIIQDQEERNQLISSTFWFNPVTGFHQWLNRVTGTSHRDNLEFRRQIQATTTKINEVIVEDEWSGVKMDKASFQKYVNLF